ncbi:MAG: VWA domain-containing protein [Pirellulales bacterium]|nr:VWA domain-containing protein [Pirellulales bacterium]
MLLLAKARWMTFADPFWLVLAIPLALMLWLWPLPSRLLFGLRCAASALLLLALCGLSVLAPVRSGVVALVADRSLSMPPGSEALQKEAADIVHSAMQPGDKLAVVSFAETAALEQSPQSGKFAGFAADVGREASSLADALDLALSLFGRGEPGRVLILSDGRWTGRELASAAARASAAGVPLDYRAIERAGAGDLAVARIEGPGSVLPGESFMITAWLDSPLDQPITYELSRAGQVIAQGERDVPAGTSRLIFRDKADRRGVREYLLRVQKQGTDPAPENNRARLLVGVRGAKPVLCVNPSGDSGLAALLAKGGIDVRSKPASQCNWTLEELAGYSAVLLENTPANLIGHVGMENLAAWVSQSGGGLMLSGGKNSYGPGGYYKSPLEPILPVSMELRREHRKLQLAIVVALDRSGSMAMTVPGGRQKMDLANLATAEVVEMLGPTDQFGCLAVDSAAHEIVPLADVTDPSAMRSKILRIDSMGGGIFVYEALSNAVRMVLKAKAGTKHIILFADAADSEEPGDYKALAEKCAKAGVTISVVGLGTEKDCDAGLLKDVARRGGGQCMFTNVAQELPRLFAQDTFLVARSAFLQDPVRVRSTGGLLSITRKPLGEFPKIGGYNLCYLRPGANLAVVAEDEYKAPVLGSWQAGLGRVLCYTGEADGQYTGPIADWQHAGDFFASLARWAAGKSQELGRDVAATQELGGGVCRIELHLDPERESPPFASLPELTLLSARPGETAATKKIGMNWATADSLLAEITLTGSETILATIAAPELGQTTLAPVCLPYSPEHLPPEPGRGVEALKRLARATGGRERLNLGDVWKDIPKITRHVSLAPYLLLLTVSIFLLEVIQRRTGILSIRLRRRSGDQRPAEEKTARRFASILKGKTKSKRPVAPAARETPPATAKAAPSKEESGAEGIADALSRARQRARKRTKG